jgi:hypothetical protein
MGECNKEVKKGKLIKSQINLETKEDELSTQPQDTLDNKVIHPQAQNVKYEI